MSDNQPNSNDERPQLIVTIDTSTPRISLSSAPEELVLLLTAHCRRTGAGPITLCTAGSVLDNGHHARHDGVFRGVFLPLTSTSDSKRKIQLHFSGTPNYGSHDAIDNLLERDYLRFETVPGKDQGLLTLTHEISLERLLRYSDLKKEDVQAGEKFTLKINPKKLRGIGGWWTWGGLEEDLKGKKFAKWELPDEQGEIGNLMPGEKFPDIERMQEQGWVFSELFHKLTIEAEGDEVTLEFVE